MFIYLLFRLDKSILGKSSRFHELIQEQERSIIFIVPNIFFESIYFHEDHVN
jgi:hypothetical protein